jgi:DNA-binding Xre family transcriptional regulator
MKQQLLVEKIQTILKDRGLSYRDVALSLSLSIPSIKRIFSKKQITLENLLEICKLLDIAPSDLFFEAEQGRLKTFRFSKEQEHFFAAHPHYLAYFYQIRGKRTPAQIKSQFGLTDKSSAKYLKKLKEFGLVRFDGRKFVSTVEGAISWDDDGPIGKIYSAKMIQDLVGRSTSTKLGGKKPLTDLKGFVLSKRQHDELLHDIATLSEKYQALSNQNSRLKQKNLEVLTSLFILGEKATNIFNDIIEI